MRESGEFANVPPRGATSRKQSILTLLRREGFSSTLELASKFNVSEMTIRRDILDLEQEGLARRVHGGATAIQNGSIVPTDFRERTLLNFERKEALAREAIKHVARGDIIALDAGSTVFQISRLLPSNLNLTVITHSLPALNELATSGHTKVFAVGGELHMATQSFSSLDSANTLSDFRFTTFFLSAGSIRDGAVYCATPYEAVMKKAMIESAGKVVLVSDSTKFTSNSMVKVCGLDRIDTLITDNLISDASFTELVNTYKVDVIKTALISNN